ncbi:MAG: TQO small subunit DoxD [Solirubrobacteraceae bacterium]
MRLLWNSNQAKGTEAGSESVSTPQWPKSAVRIGFGLVWAIDAAFKWRPGFHAAFLEMVKKSGEGQPGWLHPWFSFWYSAVQPHPHVWAYGIAATETLIALALIFGFARKLTYIVAALTALGIWSVAEGFGGPYTASSTDIGAAVIYAVVAMALLMVSLQAGTSRYSVDYLIEKRVAWWHRIAEFGARNHHPVPAEVPAEAATSPHGALIARS